MIKNGDEISGYTIAGELGRGGMGVVYRAHDKALQRDAALKMVLPGPGTPTSRRRFLREAAAIARCDHPGIIKVYSFGEHAGLPYMAMEYVDGKPLLAFLDLARAVNDAKDLEELRKYGYIRDNSPEDEELPYFLRPLAGPPLADPDHENRAAALIAGVADALYEAHSIGILHRDIKPSNILIGRKGPPKLADFGLAKFSDSSDITTGQPMLGTLRYMAPETFSGGQASAASDIYSLGTILYELMTLAHPFKGSNTAAFIKEVTQGKCTPPARFNPAVSPALALVIMKCLERSPAARYKDAREVADAIRLAARPKGLKTQFFAGIRGLLLPAGKPPEPKEADETPQQVTKENRRKAARLAGEAALAYFTDFSVEQAHDLIVDALKLDPFSVDVNAMLIVLAPHMGETSALRKAGPRMRRIAKSGTDAAARLYAGLLAEYLGGNADWLKKIEYYLGGEADDPALLAICARARMGAGDYDKARQYAARLSRSIPGGSLFPWFVDAYHNAWLGRREQWQEITTEAIRHHPGNIMLRFALIEGLIETGKLGEAQKALNEAAGLAKNNEFLLILRAELAIMRKEYKTACVELRKAIGAGQDDIIARDYYRLNKLYSLRGDRKEALRHLVIGRNLSPEMNFRTNEELAALVEGSVDYRPAFENLPPECLEFNFRMGRKALLDNLFSACKNTGIAFSTVYIFGKDAEPRAVRAWLFFNEMRQNAPKTRKIFLPALPLSSFIDASGNVLRTEFVRTQAEYGRYQATVTFAAPLRRLTPGSAESQLNIEGLWKERQGGVLDLRLDEICHRPGHRTHILALPEDSELIDTSARADEVLKSGGWRFLVYSGFSFDGDHFRLSAKLRHRKTG
jgi:serine/threonine protein kinase